jgi:hypothetical protein
VSVEYPSKLMRFGLSSEELVQAVDRFMWGAANRVLGTGAEQYEKLDKNGQPFQAFEEMTPRQLLTMAREEVQDLGVYAAMLDLRLARLLAQFTLSPAGDAR